MDKCPQGHMDLQITKAYPQVTGDSSPDTPTRVYLVQERSCVNPQCPNRGKVLDKVLHLEYDGAAQT